MRIATNAQFDVMPAWVTSDRDLISEVVRMQKNGWIIRPMPDGTLLCWHERAVTRNNAPMDFEKAVEIQNQFDFAGRSTRAEIV